MTKPRHPTGPAGSSFQAIHTGDNAAMASVQNLRALAGRYGTALALAGAALLAQAQAYPSKAIKLIVPFAPGGTTDTVARAVGEELAQAMGQPVVVENRPGAGGNIGTNAVAKAAADGYTWGMVGNSFAVNPSLYRSMPYRPGELRPVAVVAESPFIVVAGPSAPFRSTQAFVGYAREHPGRVTYASGGSGTIGHLGAHWLADLAKVKLQHIPYKGAAPALADVVGGHVQLYFDTLTSSMPFLKAGQVFPLFITTPQRLAALPDVPTAAEAGYPELTRSAWLGIVVPAATPPAVAEHINQLVNRVLAKPAFQARLRSLGASGVGGTLSEAQRFFDDEAQRWGDVVRASGAQAE